MKKALSARYLSALRDHLDKQNGRDGDRAQGIGRAALAGGLALRDLARMHEAALVALAPSHNFNDTRNGAIKRAGFFFTQALIPLENLQRATRKEHRALQRRNETLRLHTAELAAG